MAQGFRGIGSLPDFYSAVNQAQEHIGRGFGALLAGMVAKRAQERKRQEAFDRLASLAERYAEPVRARVTSTQTFERPVAPPAPGGSADQLDRFQRQTLNVPTPPGPMRPGVPVVAGPEAPPEPSDRRFPGPPPGPEDIQGVPAPPRTVTETVTKVLQEGSPRDRQLRLPGMRPISLTAFLQSFEGAEPEVLDRARFALVERLLTRPDPIKVGDALVDPETFEPLYVAPQPPNISTAKPGEFLIGPQGQVLGQLPGDTQDPAKDLSILVRQRLRAKGIDPSMATDDQIAEAEREVMETRDEMLLRRMLTYGQVIGNINARNIEQRQIAEEYRRAVDDLKATEALIDQIDALAERVNTFGPEGRILGALPRELGARTQVDADAAEMRAKAGLLANIARSLGGERGVLTNQDIERVTQLIPSIHDTREMAQRKIRAIRDIIRRGYQRAEERLRQGAFGPYPVPGGGVTRPGPTQGGARPSGQTITLDEFLKE